MSSVGIICTAPTVPTQGAILEEGGKEKKKKVWSGQIIYLKIQIQVSQKKRQDEEHQGTAWDLQLENLKQTKKILHLLFLNDSVNKNKKNYPFLDSIKGVVTRPFCLVKVTCTQCHIELGWLSVYLTFLPVLILAVAN